MNRRFLHRHFKQGTPLYIELVGHLAGTCILNKNASRTLNYAAMLLYFYVLLLAAFTYFNCATIMTLMMTSRNHELILPNSDGVITGIGCEVCVLPSYQSKGLGKEMSIGSEYGSRSYLLMINSHGSKVIHGCFV